MTKSILKFILSLSIIFPLLNGCDLKRSAIGDGGNLVVIADEFDRPLIRGALEEKFGRIIATPHDEAMFNITWENGNTIVEKTRSPLLLLATTINGDGPTAELLNRMLTPEVEEGVKTGEYSVFTRKDPWMKNQLMLVLVGRNKNELGKRIDEWIDSLYSWAVTFEIERLQRETDNKRKSYEYTNIIDDNSGFELTLQLDYIETQENDSLEFVRFIRHYPDPVSYTHLTLPTN